MVGVTFVEELAPSLQSKVYQSLNFHCGHGVCAPVWHPSPDSSDSPVRNAPVEASWIRQIKLNWPHHKYEERCTNVSRNAGKHRTWLACLQRQEVRESSYGMSYATGRLSMVVREMWMTAIAGPATKHRRTFSEMSVGHEGPGG